MIDRQTVEKILDAADIVDVVSDYVALKKRGANWVGLCPFHNDRKPSFYVTRTKGFCKCFSCGEGGSPVNFIMKIENMSYPEALRYLAKKVTAEIEADMLLLDFVRTQGCYSVKRGCETANCGLCTVFLDDKPVLSCSTLAARADGRKVTTLEGLQEEAAEFGAFIADQGAEQCGFCNPGFIMNVRFVPKCLMMQNIHGMRV